MVASVRTIFYLRYQNCSKKLQLSLLASSKSYKFQIQKIIEHNLKHESNKALLSFICLTYQSILNEDKNGFIWPTFLWQLFFKNLFGHQNCLKINFRGCKGLTHLHCIYIISFSSLSPQKGQIYEFDSAFVTKKLLLSYILNLSAL